MDSDINKKLLGLFAFLAEAGFFHEYQMLKKASESDSDLSDIMSEPPKTSSEEITVGAKNNNANLSNADIKTIQKLLIAAGFELPKHGVDGVLGEETYSALRNFKSHLKRDYGYSAIINDDINNYVVSRLREYALNKSPEATVFQESDNIETNLDTPSSGQSGGDNVSSTTLYLGDSQMVGALGRALKGVAGTGSMLAKTGSRASYWASNRRLKKELKKNPSKIIISLNGNGIGGTSSLIRLIKTLSPNSEVVWTGAPPPLKKKRSSRTWAKYLTTDWGFLAAYNKRNERNKKVQTMVEAEGWTFINPYDYIKYDEPITVAGKTIQSGYQCNGCDGIHLPSHAANAYVDKIQALV